MTLLIAILCGAFLAYSNGANDNFKGVSTLFGSETTDYRKALLWATATTFLGSIVALVLSQGLIATFSGKGLVPNSVVELKSFSIAVVLASAITVMIATKLGLPISTTHAITGALVGAGWLASSSGINFSTLGSSFFAPLIMSPAIAIIFAVIAYPIFGRVNRKLGIKKDSCVCVGTEVIAIPQKARHSQAMAAYQALPVVNVGTVAGCESRFPGDILGISGKGTLDAAHFLSAGAVSFARGLNDTPKIAALLLLGGAFSPAFTISVVAVSIAVGGLIHARKVAQTMSHRITAMDCSQGFTANLVTSLIVIFASKWGMPVSTTHVSCGALFGIGTVTRQAHLKTILGIAAAWLATLPLAALFGAVSFYFLKGVGF
ncbi:MAG: inorganic phosphate transporter [Deltaproteobacteria bacterium]|nr:inorganic phosphate transporter [Deltaproteobacteria bacterium]